MPVRKTLSKRDLLFRQYRIAFGKAHSLNKLGEECNELSQVIYKLLDREARKLPIDGELLGHFWEEMAHVLLFWGIVSDALDTGGSLNAPMEERSKRLINKIVETMSGTKYPARLILKDQDSPLPSNEMPYSTLADGTKVCYLTAHQYQAQLNDMWAVWKTPHGQECFFDEEFFEKHM